MTPPELTLRQLLLSCLLGSCLGIFYEFLRPLRTRHTVPADLLFLLALGRGLLVLDFRFCGGDLRLACIADVFFCAFLVQRTLGPVLRPVFLGFYKVSGRILGFFLLPIKIFWNFSKKLFAYMRKWVTIVGINRRNRRIPRGNDHGREEIQH